MMLLLKAHRVWKTIRQNTDTVISLICFFIYKNEDCDAEAIDKGFFNYTREEVFILNCLRIFTEYGLYEVVDKSLPISTICDYASIAAETVIDDYDCDQY